MRAIWRLAGAAVLLATILAGPPVSAEETVPPADAALIRELIEGQLAAFQKDDELAAFGLASPDIRRMFGTSERFMSMVKGGYGAVYRPREVEFRELTIENGQPSQQVFLVGPDGQPVIARYSLERQPDGRWLIDGCVLLKAPDAII